MTEQEQIEEMEKDIVRSAGLGVYEKAKYLTDLGYRKVLDGSVVLTREEYTNYMVEYMGVKEIKDRVIKETAEKILEQVKFLIEERNCVGGYDLEDETIDGTIFVEVLNELKERYGVEVEE